MSSQTEIPGTWASDIVSSPSWGDGNWATPSNAGTTGSSYATNTSGTGTASGSLQGSGCGFSVSGTVNGITQTFSRKANQASGSDNWVDYFIGTLITTGTSPTYAANNYAATSTRWPTTAASVTYGTGTTDLWGSTWTATAINASGFGMLIVGIGAKTGNEGFVNSGSVTVYYTGASPPGAPTGLSATADDDQSVTLSWTNPGGTLTDDEVQYSTDDATWTTIDIGSVATSYTVTGLSANTLYYFQVAAVNSGGTGSYCTAVTATTYPAPPFPAPLGAPMGSGACPYGITNQMRRNRIEGVKFQHK